MHCRSSACRGWLDGCRGRSTRLLERTSVTDHVGDQRLMRRANHVDHDMMLEHDRCVYVLGDVAERTCIVCFVVVALLNVLSLEDLTTVCMHCPSAQNEHEAKKHDGGQGAKHGCKDRTKNTTFSCSVFCSMRAIILDSDGLHLRDIPSPHCPPGYVRLRLHAAALNHRDQFIREGKYAKIELPAVLGSDGVGTVIEAPTSAHLIGTRMMINPALEWGEDDRAQGPNFSVLGMPTQGTFAEEIVVPEQNVYPVPEHLTDEQAAALPLAGLTGYRALITQGFWEPGQTVLITGIGGGVASLTLAFAHALGARVIVTSTSDAKLARAKDLGATAGVNVRSDGWVKQVQALGPIDCIVDSVGGDTINDLTSIIRPGGRIVVYGATLGHVPTFNMSKMFWKQIHLIGSTMGTPADFEDMVQLVETARIVPMVDSVFPLADAERAFDRMIAAEQFGKIVLRCN